MESQKITSIVSSAVFVFLAAFCFLAAGSAIAGSGDNVSGFAWSENIGWISFNNTSGGGTVDYGVNIAADGTMSGHAWSENIGWITFNEADLAGCPSGTCKAWIDTTCPSGQCTVAGWARVLANGGGWEGWIKLGGTAQDGSPYPLYVNSSTGEFHGWGWSDVVAGWINFNCADRGVCGTSDYKVETTVGFDNSPIAAMSCDGSQCSGDVCNAGSWITYRPIADPETCIYRINNDSTDPDGLADIVNSEWLIKPQGEPDTSYETFLSCPNVCNYTVQANISPGTYTIKLVVTDSTSNTDFTTHDINVRAEVEAGFMCSLDNINWQSCSGLSGKISKDEVVYFKDDPSLLEYSVASEGASIVAREWTLNGAVFGTGGNDTNPSTNIIQKNNTVRLTVTDSSGRSDYGEFDLDAKSLPEWEEIDPSGMLLNRFLAGIYRFWSY